MHHEVLLQSAPSRSGIIDCIRPKASLPVHASCELWGVIMGFITDVKNWIGALTEVALLLIGLGVVVGILVGANAPFIGNVTANLVSFVKDLGANGLVGLLVLGFILWLISYRKIA